MLFHLSPGAKDSGLYRLQGDSFPDRKLFLRPPFDNVQNEGFSQSRRNGCHRFRRQLPGNTLRFRANPLAGPVYRFSCVRIAGGGDTLLSAAEARNFISASLIVILVSQVESSDV